MIDNLHTLPTGTLSTPWRLYLAATVYSGGRDPRDLLAPEGPGTIDNALMGRLIPVALEAHPHRRYDAQHTVKWLSSLAAHSSHPDDDSVPGDDIVLHRLPLVVGRKRVWALHYLFVVLVGAMPFLAYTGDVHSGRDAAFLACLGLGNGVLWGCLCTGRAVEPLRWVRRRITRGSSGGWHAECSAGNVGRQSAETATGRNDTCDSPSYSALSEQSGLWAGGRCRSPRHGSTWPRSGWL